MAVVLESDYTNLKSDFVTADTFPAFTSGMANTTCSVKEEKYCEVMSGMSL